jgi:hypothetical protein
MSNITPRVVETSSTQNKEIRFNEQGTSEGTHMINADTSHQPLNLIKAKSNIVEGHYSTEKTLEDRSPHAERSTVPDRNVKTMIA